MRKILALVLVGFAAVTLTGCDAPAGESGFPAPKIVTIDYNGKPLNCVTWDGSHSEEGLTCDFVEYHEKYGFAE